MRRYISQLTVIGLTVVLVPLLANAWTAAPASPPAGNVSAPLNVGATQTKAGGLNLGDTMTVTSPTGGVSVNGTMYAGQGIGIGTSPFDTNGSVNALKYCINGANCIAAWPAGGGGVSSISQGTGMTFSTNPITTSGTVSLNISGISACTNAATNKIYWNGTTLVCGTDQTGGGGGTVTSLSAGSGITLSSNPITTSGTISANTAVVQSRVSGTCAAGSSIRVIDSVGGVTCQVDGGGATPTLAQVVAAGNSTNGVALLVSGAARLWFRSLGGSDPSFYESFGLHYAGDGAHPLIVDGGQLQTNAGFKNSGGNLYSSLPLTFTGPGDNSIDNSSYGGINMLVKSGSAVHIYANNSLTGLVVHGGVTAVNGMVAQGFVAAPEHCMGGGEINCITSWAQASDARLKTDIQPLSDAQSLQNIEKLQPVSFMWKDSKRGKGEQIGVVAQDVEKIYPQVMGVSTDGYKTVNYDALVAPLIGAIKEQQRQIEALNARIKALEAKNR